MQKRTVISLTVGILTTVMFVFSAVGRTNASTTTLYGNISSTHTVDYKYFTLNYATPISLEVNLETFSGEFDTVMYLFRNDGPLDSSDYLAHDDDSGWNVNSLINIMLPAGSYMTAISSYDFTLNEAIIGNNPDFSFVGDGEYKLKMTAAPVPAAVWLFGSGLLGLLGLKKKEKRSNS